MTTSKEGNYNKIVQLNENLFKSAMSYQKALLQALAGYNKNENADPLHLSSTIIKATQEVVNHPEVAIDKSSELAKDYLRLCNNFYQKLLGYNADNLYKGEGKDNRFTDEAWESNPILNFIKQSYYLNSSWLKSYLNTLQAIDNKEYLKLLFATRSLIDAYSPSNIPYINPQVLKETYATSGENLVKGAQNLLNDIENSNGNFRISTTDYKAFAVGKNLAVTPGKIVYQNELMQLIQYEATTPTVYKIPLIITPAWINKYYILDLQQNNSFVKWLVDQGYSVFMISWVNPEASLNDKGFEDYMLLGPLAALEVVKKITNSEEVNFIGYCLGGTLLASTIAYLKAKKHKKFPIKSATFLTTLVDFENAGDLCVFIDEEQLSHLEKRMNKDGYLDGSEMAATFSMIRANDMIWSFVINNYLLGRDPFPFDVLYWNSDSTRLPAKMHSFYLRNMYLKNLLCKPGGIGLNGIPIDLAKIDIPAYVLSTREDHIAPWEATYKAMSLYKGKNRFVLSASGHVVGVINHPSKNKYSYWTNDRLEQKPISWLEGAKENLGSWWNDWNKWNSDLAGEKIPARKLKKSLENAPGSYVMVTIADLNRKETKK